MSKKNSSKGRMTRRANGHGTIWYDGKRGRWIARMSIPGTWGTKRREVSGPTREIAEMRMRQLRGDFIDPELLVDEEDRNVYFVQALSGGPIKIGRANDVAKRLAILQRCCPIPLQVLHVIPGADYRVETLLHRRFKVFRLHGEWFESSRELLQYIHHLKNGGAA